MACQIEATLNARDGHVFHRLRPSGGPAPAEAGAYHFETVYDAAVTTWNIVGGSGLSAMSLKPAAPSICSYWLKM